MKCIHKRGQKQCEKSASYICTTCKTQGIYCERHSDDHRSHAKHELTVFVFSGLSHFKKEIKGCINQIAKSTEAIINELRTACLKSIIKLKKLNKNVKCIEELTFKAFDANRMSFLIEQAKQIDLEMNESPIETSERLSSILENNKKEIHSLRTEIKTMKEDLTKKDSQLQQMSLSSTINPKIISASHPVESPFQINIPSTPLQSTIPIQKSSTTCQGTN